MYPWTVYGRGTVPFGEPCGRSIHHRLLTKPQGKRVRCPSTGEGPERSHELGGRLRQTGELYAAFISAMPCGGLLTRGVVPMSVHIVFETPQDVQEQVYEMVKSLGKDGKGRLKKGANEVTKSAERGTAQMVVMAENVNPGELLAHIPMICKEKEIPFIYVEDQAYLAEAAGMSTGTRTAAIAVMHVEKEGMDRFNEVKSHFETLSS